MNPRLKRLIRTVSAEQVAAAANPSDANIESLKRCQDRLHKYLENSGRTAPFELFMLPPVLPGHRLVTKIHDECVYEPIR